MKICTYKFMDVEEHNMGEACAGGIVFVSSIDTVSLAENDSSSREIGVTFQTYDKFNKSLVVY